MPLFNRGTWESTQIICSLREGWQGVLDHIHCLPTQTCSSEHLPHRVAKSITCSNPGKPLHILGGLYPCHDHLFFLTCAHLSADGWGAYSSHGCLQPINYSENYLISDSIFCIVKTFKIPSYLCLPSTVGFCILQLPKSLCLQGFLAQSRLNAMLCMFPWCYDGKNAVRFAFYLERAISHGIHLPPDYVSCFLWSFFMWMKKVCYSSVI